MKAASHAGLLRGFAPVAQPDARLLILGSMPGAASLSAGEYYAHPRNAFWPVLEGVWGIPRSLGYEERLDAVHSAGIAIWDVLSHCRRRTSLDADIEAGSIMVNNFADFLSRQPRITCVAFNGGAAEACYRRRVFPGLSASQQELPALRMPSTSPAHAALSVSSKVQAWRVLRAFTHPAHQDSAALHPQRSAGRIKS